MLDKDSSIRAIFLDPSAVPVMRQASYLEHGRPIQYTRSIYRTNQRFHSLNGPLVLAKKTWYHPHFDVQPASFFIIRGERCNAPHLEACGAMSGTCFCFCLGFKSVFEADDGAADVTCASEVVVATDTLWPGDFHDASGLSALEGVQIGVGGQLVLASDAFLDSATSTLISSPGGPSQG
jgi:hypothetical protein